MPARTPMVPATLLSVRARWASVALLLLLGCSGDTSTLAPVRSDADMAVRASGGGSGAAPTVTSASPATAPQDTAIAVTVSGTGFKQGARAQWALAGDTTQVIVQSTKVTSSTELVAQLLVPSTAATGSYDIVVTNSDGKKGVGAEKFTVTIGNTTANWLLPLDASALSLRSDGQFSDGTYSTYADGVCSFESTLYFTGSGDNTMSMRYPKRRVCGRTFTLVFPDGYSETLAFSGGVQVLDNLSYAIPVGTTVRRHMRLGSSNTTLGNPAAGRCSAGLVFGEGGANPALGSDSVSVTRIDASTWEVASQAPPNDHAFCVDNGALYEMQLRFRIVTARALP
jgi:hypothetical protein